MSYIVKVGENRTYTVKGAKVRGFQLNAALIANAVNIAVVTTDFTAKSIPVKVELTRGGKKKVIFSDNLGSVIASSFGKANWALLNPLNGTVVNIKLLHAGAVIEKVILPYFIDFGCPIDLAENDSLDISINFVAGSQTGANLTGSTSSYIDIIEVVSTKEEFETPMIECYTLEAGITNYSKNLGSGIRKIVLLNYDKDSVLAADRPTTTVALSSDKMNYSLSAEQIQENRFNELYAAAEAAYYRHNLLLYDGSARNLNNVQLTLTTTAANVTAGNNVLVVWRRDADAQTILRASAKQRLHDVTRARRHGINVK